VNLYPAIDIRGGQAVRLRQGDYDRETVYDADPVEVAERWVQGGAERLHVVDLDGAREGRPLNADVVAAIAEAAGVPIQAGGGLRDDDAVAAVLEAGAERAVIGTAAFRDPEFIDRLVAAYGEKIIVAADARSGKVAVEGWTEPTDLDPAAAIRAMAGRGVQAFIYTPVEVDGTMEGPPIDQVRAVAGALEGTGARMIYSGGVGDLSHLRSLACLAPSLVEGVIVGKALYEGRFTVAEALAVFKDRD
jgi:phosphoribosylformimino-5-aminoimidazole carboxamide ribotide isomerase